MKVFSGVRSVMVGLATVMSLTALAGRALGQESAPPAIDQALLVGSHRVTSVVIQYVRENASHPAADAVLGARLTMTPTPGGFVPAQAGMAVQAFALRDIPSMPEVRFTDVGLAAIAPVVVQRLKELGLVGVYVVPDAAQFRVADGKVVDTRAPGDSSLVLQITTGAVTAVRTVGVGDRLNPDETLNNPAHARIRENSPVKAGEGTDLLRQDLISDYQYRLNRHPGRRVDTAVQAPGDTPGAVNLDYMVTENRPWYLFAQVSNTGSPSTNRWREHFGFVHNQLSNSDDILQLDYNTNFDGTHALSGSYERPIACSERWRWGVGASWYTYQAGDLGFDGNDFEGDGWDAWARVYYNFFQRRALFVDALAGVRFSNISVDNNLAAVSGDNQFLTPEVGLRLEHSLDQTRTDASAILSFNLADLGGTDEDTIDELGRTNADPDYAILRVQASHSRYLDPLFDKAAEKADGLAHEVYFAARGQTSFGSRLHPNEMDVAGGLYTVRGYPQAVVAGDDLLMGTAEYRFHLPHALGIRENPGTLFNKPFRWRPQYAYGPTDWDLILRAFLDAARVVNADRLSFEADHTLIGAGVGAEVSITRRVNLRGDVGFALQELEDAGGGEIVNAGHAELHVVLTVIF